MSQKKRTAAMQNHPEHGVAAQFHESIDDDPLPNEQKILALHQIDNDILPWLKRNYEKARDQQHEYNMEQLKAKAALDRDDRKDRAARRGFRWVVTLTSAFLLLVCCVSGGYLIYIDKPLGATQIGRAHV